MKKLRFYIEYITVLMISFVIYNLPYSFAMCVGNIIGDVFYLFDRKHRSIAESNIKKSFINISDYRIKNIVKNLYRHIGKSFIEFVKLYGRKRGFILDRVKVIGMDNLKSILFKNKGAIIILGHFGNWELAGAKYAQFVKTSAIVFPQSNSLTDNLINKIRQRCQINTIFTGKDSIRKVIKALNGGEVIGFLADQDAGDNGVFVDFLGRPASTHKGPVAIALKTGAPVIMTFIIRNKDDTHTLYITQEIKLKKTGEYEKDIVVNTQKWVSILENYIKSYPDFWFWVHRRWKTVPPKK